jgi:RHS repeat-associated protein
LKKPISVGLVLTPDATLTPITVNGRMISYLDNQTLKSVSLDMRNSVISNDGTPLSIPEPYGDRDGNRTDSLRPRLIDYALTGYDADLRAYRMDHRDYDPAMKRFLTPDPLFLENPEKCIESPVECSLYGYSKGNPIRFVDPSGLAAGDVWLYHSDDSWISNAIVWAEQKVAGVSGQYSHAGLEIDSGRVYTATGSGANVIQAFSEAVNFGGPRQIDVYSHLNASQFNLAAAVQYAEQKTFQMPQMSIFSRHGTGQGANTYASYGVCSDATQKGLNSGGLETSNYGFFTTPNDFGKDSQFHYSHSFIDGQKVETYGPAH